MLRLGAFIASVTVKGACHPHTPRCHAPRQATLLYRERYTTSTCEHPCPRRVVRSTFASLQTSLTSVVLLPHMDQRVVLRHTPVVTDGPAGPITRAACACNPLLAAAAPVCRLHSLGHW
jgi:hypothetical protein